jgi:hypothetical protein
MAGNAFKQLMHLGSIRMPFIERNKNFYKTTFVTFTSQFTSTYEMEYCYCGEEIPWWLLQGKKRSDVQKTIDG